MLISHCKTKIFQLPTLTSVVFEPWFFSLYFTFLTLPSFSSSIHKWNAVLIFYKSFDQTSTFTLIFFFLVYYPGYWKGDSNLVASTVSSWIWKGDSQFLICTLISFSALCTTFILLLYLYLWCWLKFILHSLLLRFPGRSWCRRWRFGRGRTCLFLPNFWFLGNIWKNWRWNVIEHIWHSLMSQRMIKILRGPWGENNRAGISWISNCCCWEIRRCLEFIHPTGCTARRTIPPYMGHMLDICRIPNFHLSFFYHKDLGDVLETLIDPFDFGCHGENL